MKYYLNISLLLLTIFSSIQSSDQRSEREQYFKEREEKGYKKYIEEQEEIYKDLMKLSIPGARRLKIDKVLAEEVLTNCPQEVNDLVSDIEEGVFCIDKKNALFQGAHGTGKSCLAQAVAIKTQAPCLFFDAERILAESMKSGLEIFEKIFQQAESLEEKRKKPSVIIFDKLEALTRKDAAKNKHENNTLVDFWGRLDDLDNSKVVTIGTMDSTEYLPVEVTSKTSVIEIPLPDLQQREKILSYHLKTIQDKHGLTYSPSVTPAILAEQTNGFTHRQLQNLVEGLTNPVIKVRDRSNKRVVDDKLPMLIKNIKKNSKLKLVPTLKTYIRGPINPFVVLGAIGLANQRRGFDIQERGLEQAAELATEQRQQVAELAEKQRDQTQANFDYQTSWPHMTKQAAYNIPGIAIGAAIRTFFCS